MFKKIKNIIELLLFIITKFFLGIIGFKNASRLGGLLFKIIGPRTKYYKIIKINLSLLNYDNEKIRKIAVKNLEQIGKTFFEFILINKLNKKLISITGEKYLKDIRINKKPFFFISAHYGNWEITRNFLVNYGFNLHTVYRQANNELIDSQIQKIRKKKGAFFYKKGHESAKSMIKALRNKHHIAILIDQKDNRGSKINFLNKDAYTNTGFANLALKYKTGICILRSERDINGGFKIIVEKPFVFDDFKHLSDIELTQLIYKKYIEKWIINDPTQWLWAHKRWS